MALGQVGQVTYPLDMATINLYDAKTHLSQLVDRAARGEDVVIGKAGKPLVRMIPYHEAALAPREPGGCEGRIIIHDDFDVLPDDVLAAFEGESD